MRLLQRQYSEALAAYEEARQTFEQLNEPFSVSISWHQIGWVHQEADQYDEAEKAYQTSLRIKAQIGDRSGEARTLHQIGNLYNAKCRFEEAVRFYQQAATIFRELSDLASEGHTCNNLANTLIKLKGHDAARRQLLRAIECKEPFGHSSEPWKTFHILSELERTVGNMAAADAARKRAFDAYLAYRRDGGQNPSAEAVIFNLVAQAIADDQVPSAESLLAQLEGEANLPAPLKALLPKLQAILRGARDPSLAADPDLHYDDAVELDLLLERLARDEAA